MRKLIFHGHLILFLALTIISCKKADVLEEGQPPSSKTTIDLFTVNKTIKEAKDFFENEIVTSQSQKFKKNPNWEKAYIGKMTSGIDKVLVPLKYDKLYSFKTSFSGNKKFTLEEQSFLSVYKDASGSYHADVITIYPDQSFLNNMNQQFQGLLTIDDWNENRINTYLYKDGNLYKVEEPHFNSPDNSTQTSGRTNEICMTVYWYWCEGWESDISQCSYIGYTTYENCADFQSLQPPGEGGEYVDLIPVNAPKLLNVWSDDWCQIIATYTVFGEKSYTTPSLNKFTNIVPGDTYLANNENYWNTSNNTWNAITYGWNRDTHGESYSTFSVSVSLSGHWMFQPVWWNQIRWEANGAVDTKTKVRSDGWTYSQCF